MDSISASRSKRVTLGGMNIFFVVALIAVILAIISFFVAWPLYPFLIVAGVSALIGALSDGGLGGGRRY